MNPGTPKGKECDMKKELEKQEDVAVKREQISHARVAPLMRFSDTEEAFELRFNLPGVEQKNLQVQVADNALVIEARREESARDGMTCVRQEFPVVDYQAAYELPDDVDASAIGAKLANGILTVTLKKREAAKPRRIAVSVA
jgi:HSP20 family protein